MDFPLLFGQIGARESMDLANKRSEEFKWLTSVS